MPIKIKPRHPCNKNTVVGQRPMKAHQLRDFIIPLKVLLRPGIKVSLHQKGNKPATISVRYRSVNRLFNWCLERGLLEVSPAALIKAPNKEKTRDRTLSDEELAEIWTATKALGYPLTPYCRLLILTLRGSGGMIQYCT